MTNRAIDVFKFIDTRDGDGDQCWPWLGALSGKDRDRGYFTYEGKRIAAHRHVFELVHGPLLEGELVRHTCDNPRCVNPYHMVRGTRSDNERDKYMRDRAGMPVAVVREIRRLLSTGMTHQKVADTCTKKFDVNVSRVYVTKMALGYRRALEGEQTAEEIADEFLKETNPVRPD